jgi:hypothetical protein
MDKGYENRSTTERSIIDALDCTSGGAQAEPLSNILTKLLPG